MPANSYQSNASDSPPSSHVKGHSWKWWQALKTEAFSHMCRHLFLFLNNQLDKYENDWQVWKWLEMPANSYQNNASDSPPSSHVKGDSWKWWQALKTEAFSHICRQLLLFLNTQFSFLDKYENDWRCLQIHMKTMHQIPALLAILTGTPENGDKL